MLRTMSINAAQRRQTAAELQSLRATLPVTDEALADRLGWTTGHVARTLAVEAADPRQTWRLRDTLAAVARAYDLPLPEFSTLKDSRRADAVGWFGTWDVPDVAGL